MAYRRCQQSLECKPRDGSRRVAVEDILSAFDLLPVDPVRDSIDLVPQLLQSHILVSILPQEGECVTIWLGVLFFGFGIPASSRRRWGKHRIQGIKGI